MSDPLERAVERARNDKLLAEIDRLRAENAALSEVERLARIIADCYWKQPVDVYGAELRKALSELDENRITRRHATHPIT